MSEWRVDENGRRVLLAPERGDRPMGPRAACPFCEGHEGETPGEVFAERAAGTLPNGPGWRVRVVPNRFAAVRFDASGPNPGVGVAEVFIESPRHETAFRNLGDEQATLVLKAWRDRLRFWRADGRLAFAQVFKNEGSRAGATVEHCHSQLIGVPFVPADIDGEWRAHEVTPERVVVNSERFAVSCPHAPRMLGETWIEPKDRSPRYEDTSDDELSELAGTLLGLLGRIDRAFGGPDLNIIVRSAPFRREWPSSWRLEIVPRTTAIAGWELATGLFINTLLPERAADLLRAVGQG